MAEYDRDFLTAKHDLYEDNILNWEFHIRSFLGGNDYALAKPNSPLS